MDDEVFEPSLEELVSSKTLRWIWVGGKGGVGKTTTSSSLAVQLAKRRESVLLISTDPAHNLSDAFKQKFGPEPSQVNGIDNLWAMEIEPNASMASPLAEGMPESLKEHLPELGGAFAGMDEFASMFQTMQLSKDDRFDVVVFDTAPTGHTLRMLAMPEQMQTMLKKLLSLKEKFGGMFTAVRGMLGPEFSNVMDPEALATNIEKIIDDLSRLQEQFSDPERSTFVCVCIPEFLSLYETERLVQELAKNGYDSQNIVVNQVLYPPAGSDCKMCQARGRMQQKYLEQIDELYMDFHVVKMPLLESEVRGVDRLELFGNNLVTPYEPPTSS